MILIQILRLNKKSWIIKKLINNKLSRYIVNIITHKEFALFQ